MSGFKPSLFIATGDTNAVYTLKVKRLHSFYIGFKKQFEVRSEHVCTLSTDPDVAYSKALVYSRHHNIALETKRSELRKVRDIERSNSSGNSNSIRKQSSPTSEKHFTHEENISRGVFPVGKHAGKSFHQAPPEYITWLIDRIPTLEDGLIKDMALAVQATCEHMRLPIADKEKHFGSIGDEIDLYATVVDKIIIGRKSDHAKYDFNMIILITDDNSMLLIRTNQVDPKIGDKIRLAGTIKKHSEYKGQSQTEIEIKTVS